MHSYIRTVVRHLYARVTSIIFLSYDFLLRFTSDRFMYTIIYSYISKQRWIYGYVPSLIRKRSCRHRVRSAIKDLQNFYQRPVRVALVLSSGPILQSNLPAFAQKSRETFTFPTWTIRGSITPRSSTELECAFLCNFSIGKNVRTLYDRLCWDFSIKRVITVCDMESIIIELVKNHHWFWRRICIYFEYLEK